MADVGDIAALWRRIDAWPGELKQAFKLEAEAKSQRDDLRQRLYGAGKAGASADEDEDEDYSPPSREKVAARRKANRAALALEQARDEVTRRVVQGYEDRGQKIPAARNVRALVESEDDVKSLREAYHLAQEELEDIQWQQEEQANAPVSQTADNADGQGSTDLDRLRRALADAEHQVSLARVEVKHQRAVGRALQLLVQLASSGRPTTQ